MIGGVLSFIRKSLDAHLKARLAIPGDPIADKVVFLDGDKMDPVAFPEGAVTELLVKVEEERLLRGADPYKSVQEDGKPLVVSPPLRLGLHLLFVSRFKQYDLAWDHLAEVADFLRTHRCFERADHADLPAGVERLAAEMMSQSFAEQNEVWAALRAAYHPSLLYRVSLAVLRDAHPAAADPITQQPVIHVRSLA